MRTRKISDAINYHLGITKYRCLDFIPTWNCNARCITCDSWKIKSNNLSRAQAINIINNHLFNDLELIVIEGGEVMLWPYLEEFVKIILNFKTWDILIITNGSNLNYWDKMLYSWKHLSYEKPVILRDRLRFVVSLNGIEDIHDKTRRLTGGFRQADLLIGLFRHPLFQLRTTIQYVPFKFNEDEYWKLIEYADKNGCELIVDHPSHATKFEGSKDLEPVDPDKLKKMYKDRMSRINWFRRWQREYFLWHVENKVIMPCVAGRMFAHVNPDGLIKPCAMVDDSYSFGKVDDNGLILTTSVLRENVKRIPYECQWQNGGVCCDYLLMYSAAKLPHYLLKWKARDKIK